MYATEFQNILEIYNFMNQASRESIFYIRELFEINPNLVYRAI